MTQPYSTLGLLVVLMTFWSVRSEAQQYNSPPAGIHSVLSDNGKTGTPIINTNNRIPPSATITPINNTYAPINNTYAPKNNAYQATGACDAACGSACDSACGSGCCDSGLFGKGFIKRSDHSFNSFISPMTNPVFFEDPRMVTEARAIFLNHKLPLAAAGGDVQLYAMQLRARLSENVSLIATKDGYITSQNALVNDGWADLAAGLKFALLRDCTCQRLLSAGFTYELPTGEASAFQGNGHGELNMFMTGGRKLGCRSHWISAFGFRLPLNNTDESTSTYWSNHFDYQIGQKTYLIAEANWYHWLEAGRDGPLPGIEGLDVMNFGNPGVAGNDIVTAAFGAKFKPGCHSELGVAWELPVTERRDILENRLTVDWIIRY